MVRDNWECNYGDDANRASIAERDGGLAPGATQAAEPAATAKLKCSPGLRCGWRIRL
jgi:hypothetical protein